MNFQAIRDAAKAVSDHYDTAVRAIIYGTGPILVYVDGIVISVPPEWIVDSRI